MRRDKAGQGRKQRTGSPGTQGRDRKRGGLDHQRIEAGRGTGDFGIAHGPHRRPPGTAGQPMKRHQRHSGRGNRQQCHRTLTAGELAQRRPGDAHDAVLTAGQAAHFDNTVFDDEAERNGDHGQIRPPYPQRRQGQQGAAGRC